jgi:acetyl-CoA acetyltransferase
LHVETRELEVARWVSVRAAGAQTAVVGVGHSRLFRRDDIPLGVLALEAVTQAIADAGIKTSDIDGLATSPFQAFDGAGDLDGLNVVTPELVQRALKLDLAWSERNLQPVGASLINTIHAVAAGQCTYAVCFRALHSPSGRRYGHWSQPAGGQEDPARQSFPTQFTRPYGMFAPAKFALLATAHMAKYGSSRGELARFVVRNREQALQWPYGYWYQHSPAPLTTDTYLAARMVSSPLCLYDCDLPVQAAAAFVVTTADRAQDLRHRPAYVLATASPYSLRRLAPQSLEEYLEDGRRLANHLWRTAGIDPTDVDVANLYDGFSVHTPLWAEALGLCREGEGFAFVAEPTLPLNTSSGNLGSGRTHGIPHLIDSVLQTQRRAGTRQMEGVEICVAVTNPCDNGAGFVFSNSPR